MPLQAQIPTHFKVPESRLPQQFSGWIDSSPILQPGKRRQQKGRFAPTNLGIRGLCIVFAGMLFCVVPTASAVVPSTAAYIFGTPTTVGAAESGMAVITISAAGTLNSINVVTQGIPNQDFMLGGSGSCLTGAYYFVGQTCTVGLTFQPKYPGARQGAVVLLACDGSVLGGELLDATGLGPLTVFLPGFIQGVAGNGQWIYQGDGGLATNASLYLPMDVVPDVMGNLFISDSSNHRIRRVDAGTGVISTIAGTGWAGYSGDGGPASSAALNTPSGLVVDGAGDIFIADSGNNVIRMISAATGIIKTLAGVGGQPGFSGDGGPATQALLSHPNGLAFDGDHLLYISDTGNNVIRKLDFSQGIVTTVAGTGIGGVSGDGSPAVNGALNKPWGIALGNDGSLYIADLANNRIRKVSMTGILSTVVGVGTAGFGGDGGLATQAILDAPAGVTVDVAGNLYLADSGNQVIRKVSASTGNIITIAGSIAGSPTGGNLGNNYMATDGSLDGPYSVSLDGAGNAYIADMFHHMIRKLQPWVQELFLPPIRVSNLSAPSAETIENDGNAPLNFLSFSPIQTALDPTSTTCITTQSVAINATCILGLELAPTIVANPGGGQLILMTDAVDGYGEIYASADVMPVDPTIAVLSSSTNPAVEGTPVVFSTTVTTAGTYPPTGFATFMDGPTVLGKVGLNNSNSATLSTTNLSLGAHTITVTYGGDSENAAATSLPLVESVQQPTTTALISNPNPSTAETAVAFTASVQGPSGATVLPSGTVAFYDGPLGIGTASLNAGGVATLSISSLSPGAHNVSARYSGDSMNISSQSATLVQTVAQMPTKTTINTLNVTVFAGASITLTSIVSRTDGNIPTGVVTFMDGGASIGAATLDGTGTVTWTAAGLSAGTHSISAVYEGDTNNLASTSPVFVETIQQITTSTVLTANADPSSAGAMLQFTATVSAPTAETGPSHGTTTSGTMTFQDGPTVLGTAGISVSGVATLSVSTLSVGAHSVVATYGGNTNYTGSASSPMLETIISDTTSTILVSSLTPSIAGQQVMLTATVGGTGGIATGTVAFFDGTGAGATSLGSLPLNNKGVANLTTSILASGQHTLTATYGGDAKNSVSTSQTIVQIVQVATTATTIVSASNPSSFGSLVTFTANITTNGGTPTGAVTFSDGGTPIGTETVVAGSANFSTSSLGLGTHSITATYNSGANNSASQSTVSQLVRQAGGILLVSSANPTTALTMSSFFATIAAPQGVAVTGTVTFSDGATVLGLASVGPGGIATFSLSTLSAGQHSIVASYSGDTNNQAALSGTLVQTMQIASTNVTLTSSLNPSLADVPLVLSSTVTGNGGGLTGYVTFQDGTKTLGTANLNAGSATFLVAGLSPGLHPIIATYSGDVNNSQSASPLLSQSVVQTTTVLLASGQNPSLALDSVTFTAKTSNGSSKPPSGSVVFTDGATTLGKVILDATGTATLTAASMTVGQHPISVAYGADAVDLPSVSAVLTQSVQLRPTADTLTVSSTTLTVGQQVTLISVVHFSGPVTPTGVVTFTSNGTLLGTGMLDNTGVASLTVNQPTGAPNMTASYSGDGDYAASFSTQASITAATHTQLTMLMTPSTLTLQSQQHSTLALTLNSLNNFSDTLNLGCNGLPFAATCTFTSDRVALGADGVQTVQLVVDTGSPLTSGSQARLEQRSTTTLAAICFLPGGMLLGLFFGKSRRRMRVSLAGLLPMLLLVSLMAGLSGCSGLHINGTAAGTYVFQVTATGTSSGLIQATDVTLTVTQ